MHCGELLDIEPIRQNSIWLSFQEMLAFERGDMGDGSEDVCRVRRGSLNTVPVIDATLTSLCIHIEVL